MARWGASLSRRCKSLRPTASRAGALHRVCVCWLAGARWRAQGRRGGPRIRRMLRASQASYARQILSHESVHGAAVPEKLVACVRLRVLSVCHHAIGHRDGSFLAIQDRSSHTEGKGHQYPVGTQTGGSNLEGAPFFSANERAAACGHPSHLGLQSLPLFVAAALDRAEG